MGTPQDTRTSSSFLEGLSADYDRCKLPDISHRHFRHSQLMKALQGLQTRFPNLFELEKLGTSVEGRSLNLLTLGKGKIKIFMWSQMHGDESTATRALLDMLNFMGTNATEEYIRAILEKTTLLLLPMLNPDGAERFERRNAQGIDINRDAAALQTTEARVFKSVRDQYRPDFGFNLHDQDPRFAVGQSDRIAAIALLAPAFDKEKSMNDVRLRAKHVAALIADVVSHFIPGHVSRYDDSFDIRAFGDATQQSGTSTVLLESGGWIDSLTGRGDPDKEYLRKLNTISLLAVCHAVASGKFRHTNIETYEALPENNKNVFDVMIKNAVIQTENTVAPIKVDLGINIEYRRDGESNDWTRVAQVADLGDLSSSNAFRTIEGDGKTLSVPLPKIGSVISIEELETGSLFRK